VQDDQWYAATVEQTLGDDLYKIAWLDGDTVDCLKRSHELKPMRYHPELQCYLEEASQSTASEPQTSRSSASKSDSEEEEDQEKQEEDKDWVEQIVAALDSEAEDSMAGELTKQPATKPEVRPKLQLSRQKRDARVKQPQLGQLRDQQGQQEMPPNQQEAWQEPREVLDLRARVARQVLHIAKPPPAISFTEMWCHDYFLRHPAPKAPRTTGPLIAEVGDLWLVTGGCKGGIRVRAAGAAAPCMLSPGSLVRALRYEDGGLQYALLTGSGPSIGWAATQPAAESGLAKVVEGASLEVDPASGRNARAWAAKTSRRADAGDCLHCRCRIPAGGSVCVGLEGEVLAVHAECMARLLQQAEGALCVRLEEEREEAEAREDEELALKRLLHMEGDMQKSVRAQFGIGWREELVPCNVGPARKLGLELDLQGMCCLAVDEDSLSVRLARTNHPGVCVNLEYLSLALRMGLLEGAQPWFSLDPVDPTSPTTMLSKNFGPEWLAGTSVGDVLFQADYYLKELSMGQFKQPLPGMKSCWDFADGNVAGPDWDARIWFVVLDVEVNISEDDVLIPCVKMGVEARELVSGSYEDAPVTRPDHPLVKYAEMFTREFDAIAERVSVVYYLRELAKASALAKFLADNGYETRDAWLSLAAAARECQMEAPRLWNRRLASAAGDGPEAGLALAAEEGCTNMLYGGVDLSLRRFVLQKPKRVSARLSEAEASGCLAPAIPATTLSIFAY